MHQSNTNDYYDQFDIEQLQTKMNTYDWQPIDKYLPSTVPQNKYYQVEIPNQSIQKYYLRFRYILQHTHTHLLLCTLALCTYLLKSSTNNYYALMLRKKIVNHQFNALNNEGQQNDTKCQRQQKQSIKRRVLERELKFMNNLLEDNPKQYHVWTYKKDLISLVLNNNLQQNTLQQLKHYIFTTENKFIFTLLIQDCRNYHAWDYRFWLVTFLDKIEDELKWVQGLINVNNDSLISQVIGGIGNSGELQAIQLKINWVEVNSLWSHRFNLIKYMQNNQKQQHLKQILHKQISQIIMYLKVNNKNQPLWNYLSGLINLKLAQLDNDNDNVQNENIKQQLKQIYHQKQIQLLQIDHLNRFELNFLKKHLSLFGLQNHQQIQLLNKKILLRLQKIDPVREKYYDYLIENEQ